MTGDPDLDRQIARLEGQIDRMRDGLDAAFVRKEVFASEAGAIRAAVAAVQADVARIDEGLKWIRRSVIGLVVGMVLSVVGAFLISHLIG